MLAELPRPGGPTLLSTGKTHAEAHSPIDIPTHEYPFKLEKLSSDGSRTSEEVVRDLNKLLGEDPGHYMIHGRDDEG